MWSKLYELTESETDEELVEYNEFLLDSLEDAKKYIQQLEKRIPKKEYSLDEVEELNKKYSFIKETITL